MAEKPSKGGGHAKPSGGGGGGGGHATEKAKAFVESGLALTEVAAYNVLPYITATRELFRSAAEQGSSHIFGGYLGGLWLAFIYSFGKEMLKGMLDKLAGGGGGH